MKTKRPIKILMSKPGLDGHDRGIKVLTLALRDEGFEVIYTGLRQTPEAVVKAAIEEDVDVIGISCLTGNYEILCQEIIQLLRDKGVNDKVIMLGGIILDEDIPNLKKMGVDGIFGPGAQLNEIVQFIKENARKK
jgi:methylmalonyl-CoA mutase, C-terminal domain